MPLSCCSVVFQLYTHMGQAKKEKEMRGKQVHVSSIQRRTYTVRVANAATYNPFYFLNISFHSSPLFHLFGYCGGGGGGGDHIHLFDYWGG